MRKVIMRTKDYEVIEGNLDDFKTLTAVNAEKVQPKTKSEKKQVNKFLKAIGSNERF